MTLLAGFRANAAHTASESSTSTSEETVRNALLWPSTQNYQIRIWSRGGELSPEICLEQALQVVLMCAYICEPLSLEHRGNAW